MKLLTVPNRTDFSRRSLRSNLVLRWEYRPDNSLFVVWQQNHSASPDGAESASGRRTCV